ncbi:carboxypeptidase, partial [Brachionus plicatilis]
MLFHLTAIIILLCPSLTTQKKFSFEGYKLIQIKPKSIHHIQLLNSWENNPDFDVWNRIKLLGETVDVALSPKAFDQYQILFKLANIPFTLVNDNIQKLLDHEEESMHRNLKNSNIVGRYARYTEVSSFISNLVTNNPDIASFYSAGTTYENRELKVLVLNSVGGRSRGHVAGHKKKMAETVADSTGGQKKAGR